MAEGYWFKRRRYGYGWTPASGAGWLCVGAVLAVTVGGAVLMSITQPQTAGPVIVYLAAVAAAVVALVVLCVRKGPKARWRWGAAPGDDPTQDF